MDPKRTYYAKLDQDRNRFLQVGFNLTGVPVDDEHEAYLREQQEEGEREQMEKRAADAFGDNQSSRSQKAAQTQQTVLQLDRQSPSPSIPGNGTRSSQSAIKDDGSVSLRDRVGQAEMLPENIWPVLLLFDNRRHFEGKVLLDTGAADNWISEKVVQEYNLPWERNEDNEVTYQGFSSQPVKSLGVVRAQWIYRRRTIPVNFNIAPNAPWQVLFRYRYLLQTEVLTVNHDNTDSWVAPLTKREQKPSAADEKQMVKSEDSNTALATDIEQYREWREKMRRGGWTWDAERNNFYKLNGRGGREYCQDGYRINFRVADALQRN